MIVSLHNQNLENHAQSKVFGALIKPNSNVPRGLVEIWNIWNGRKSMPEEASMSALSRCRNFLLTNRFLEGFLCICVADLKLFL